MHPGLVPSTVGSGLVEPARPYCVGELPAADGFLNDYPTVPRVQAVALLDQVTASWWPMNDERAGGRIRAGAARGGVPRVVRSARGVADGFDRMVDREARVRLAHGAALPRQIHC